MLYTFTKVCKDPSQTPRAAHLVWEVARPFAPSPSPKEATRNSVFLRVIGKKGTARHSSCGAEKSSNLISRLCHYLLGSGTDKAELGPKCLDSITFTKA